MTRKRYKAKFISCCRSASGVVRVMSGVDEKLVFNAIQAALA